MAYHPKVRTIEWGTPKEIFDPLNQEFKFTLDPCASAGNAKCVKYFTTEDDGLKQSWDEHRVFLNPPYGREITKWVEKAANSKALVVGLLPARTDTQWFHSWVLNKAEIRWVKGRIYFESPGFKRDRAPFPAMITVWKNL